ncbi:hypothetical protein BLNAU_7345 [Blattamonas nauphoetae]|uniref:Uncharacterized protein n=1 Tax=Blattamonas nauphoetae TaxID=2049346 RepID=A0ABQ9Y1S2_9EUKA|nr:hypothetical protein BLNAU_7345 [Blattamonas nauphoetae]
MLQNFPSFHFTSASSTVKQHLPQNLPPSGNEDIHMFDMFTQDYGKQCIQDIFHSLDCDHLTNSQRVITSVHLWNCFAKETGQKPYKITDRLSSSEVMKQIDKADLPMIYGWIRDIDIACRFYHGESWSTRINEMMTNLTLGSHAAVERLSHMKEQTLSLKHHAEQTVEMQTELLKQQQGLKGTMNSMLQTQLDQEEEQRKGFQQMKEIGIDIRTNVNTSLSQTAELLKLQESVERSLLNLTATLSDSLNVLLSSSARLGQMVGDSIENQQEMTALQSILKQDLQNVSATQKEAQHDLQSILARQKDVEELQRAIKASQLEMRTEMVDHFSLLTSQTNELSEGMSQSLQNEKALIEAQKKAKTELDMLSQQQLMSFNLSSAMLSNLIAQQTEVTEVVKQQSKVLQKEFGNIQTWLEKLFKGNNSILLQLFDIWSILFYSLALYVGHHFTSTPSTQRARLWIYTSCAIGLVLEKIVNKASLSFSFEDVTQDSLVRTIRITLVVVSVVFIVIAKITHFDFARETYQATLENNRQMQELSHTLSMIQFQTVPSHSDHLPTKTPQFPRFSALPSSPYDARENPSAEEEEFAQTRMFGQGILSTPLAPGTTLQTPASTSRSGFSLRRFFTKKTEQSPFYTQTQLDRYPRGATPSNIVREDQHFSSFQPNGINALDEFSPSPRTEFFNQNHLY